MVVDETYPVEAATETTATGTQVEPAWPDTKGKYIVRARMDGQQWRQKNLTKQYADQTDCLQAMAKIDANGGFGIWVTKDCEDTESL